MAHQSPHRKDEPPPSRSERFEQVSNGLIDIATEEQGDLAGQPAD